MSIITQKELNYGQLEDITNSKEDIEVFTFTSKDFSSLANNNDRIISSPCQKNMGQMRQLEELATSQEDIQEFVFQGGNVVKVDQVQEGEPIFRTSEDKNYSLK